MIKIITKFTIVAILLAGGITKAQNFQGQAFYESKTNMQGAFKLDSPSMTEEMKKQMLERMKKAFEKSYVLTFNKIESIYEEEQKLDAPTPGIGGGMMVKMQNSTDGRIYKNTKDKVTLTELDFLGKEFLVTDSLATYKWNLETESKKIGEYTCYKATYIIPVSEKDKQDFANFQKKQSESKTQFIMMDEPKERLITVWYTPEIPISHGPSEYWGLPGLILEANVDKTVILCSKIILNPKEKVSIKKPKTGKKVTKEEYESLMKNQFEQMKDGNGGIKIEVQR